MSNLRGRPRQHPAPRLADGLPLMTRHVIGFLTDRHPNLVAKYCQPIACDVETRLPLYDADEAERVLKRVPRRERDPVLA